MTDTNKLNTLSISRDFKETHSGDKWDTKTVIGERTGREWIYFEGENLNQQIRIPKENLLDPLDWR